MKMKREKKHLAVKVPIVSIGDIAFLLIIFFMVTSHFVSESHIELEKATSADIEQLEETSISVKLDQGGVIWVQGDQVPLSGVQNAIEELLVGQEKKTVMLTVDKSLPQSSFGPAILEISDAGAEIAMVGVKE